MRNTKRAAFVNTTVGKNIKHLRQSRGWSRETLGKKIDCTHQQILKYEAATNRVSSGRLQLIADAYEVPVGDLFPESNEAPNKRSRITLELVRSFNNLTPKQQNAIVTLVRSL